MPVMCVQALAERIKQARTGQKSKAALECLIGPRSITCWTFETPGSILTMT